MRKPCRIIKQESDNGEIMIIGNHHWKEIAYKVPEWNEDAKEPEAEACFNYLENTYFLSQFMRTAINGTFKEYDGYHSDSFFSGILVKYSNCGDAVQVYTYIA